MSEVEAPPYQLNVVCVNGADAAGGAVMLRITLANCTGEPATIEHWSPWFEFEFDLRGPDGRELPRTRFGNLRYRERDVALTGASVVPAGQTWTHELLLSRIFDCTVAGTYRLSMWRDVRDPRTGEWVTVRSSALAFDLRDA